MNRAIGKALAVAISASGFCGASHAGVLETYSSSGWTIVAYASDRTNEFTHCTMSGKYSNGFSLIFSMTRSNNWYMGLSSANWSLTAGEKYRLDIVLDGARGTSLNGEAVSRTALRAQIEDSAALFGRFSRARVLTVKTADGSYNFNLGNSATALEEVEACTGRHQGAGSRKPFGRGGPRDDGDSGGRHIPPGGGAPYKKDGPRGDSDNGEREAPGTRPNPLDDLFPRGERQEDRWKPQDKRRDPREERPEPRELPPGDDGREPKSAPDRQNEDEPKREDTGSGVSHDPGKAAVTAGVPAAARAAA